MNKKKAINSVREWRCYARAGINFSMSNFEQACLKALSVDIPNNLDTMHSEGRISYKEWRDGHRFLQNTCKKLLFQLSIEGGSTEIGGVIVDIRKFMLNPIISGDVGRVTFDQIKRVGATMDWLDSSVINPFIRAVNEATKAMGNARMPGDAFDVLYTLLSGNTGVNSTLKRLKEFLGGSVNPLEERKRSLFLEVKRNPFIAINEKEAVRMPLRHRGEENRIMLRDNLRSRVL